MVIKSIGANHFTISTAKGTYLQSYDSIVCFIDNEHRITLGNNWDYSRTTAKYLTKFIGASMKYIRIKLELQEFTLDKTLGVSDE